MSAEKKRVLIVDDSPDDIHFVMESFSQDYAVLAATSGEKALQIAARDPQPDVILMDVEMPSMNGYETCRRLKQEEKTRNIHVIFFGGVSQLIKNMPEDEEKRGRLRDHLSLLLWCRGQSQGPESSERNGEGRRRLQFGITTN